MAQRTQDEKTRIRQLANAYETEYNTHKQQRIASCTQAQQTFLRALKHNLKDNEVSQLANQFEAALRQPDTKPSQFIRQHLNWLLEQCIPKMYHPHLLEQLDACIERPYLTGYLRRPFRSHHYSVYQTRIFDTIVSFMERLDGTVSVADALTLHANEGFCAYVQDNSWRCFGILPETIAYELDHGNVAVEEALIECMNSEGARDFSREMIYGILYSHNQKMHTYLGKMLVAARLQEGLRQAICESADAGCIAAFRTLLTVIESENLIRFSSVKRAVGTWLGIVGENAKDLDRIGTKSLTQIRDCLDSESKRAEMLASEDAMAIFTALWGLAFCEIDDAFRAVQQLSTAGSRHQLLVTGYFAAQLANKRYMHRLSKTVIPQHLDEPDILAVYLPFFMQGWHTALYHYRKTQAPDWNAPQVQFYDSTEEAERFYIILQNLYAGCPKKDREFAPCIFPWYSATLRRSDLVLRMGITAAILRDTEKIDACVALIPQVATNDRTDLVKILLTTPTTTAQLDALTDALCDKESYTRNLAFELISANLKTQINPPQAKQFRRMEELLRYKAADARAHLTALLMQQPDDALYGSVERLLTDTKEEKRTAGLDLVMQLANKAERKELMTKCLPLVHRMQHPSGKERILMEHILGQKAATAFPDESTLYHKKDKYRPQMPNDALRAESAAVFAQYFPDSALPKQICGQFNGITDTLKKLVSSKACNSYQLACDDLKSLRDCIYAHRTEEYRTPSGEMATLDSGRISRSANEAFPFWNIWTEWAQKRSMTPERILRARIVLAQQPQPNAPEYHAALRKTATEVYGKGFGEWYPLEYSSALTQILEELVTQQTDYVQTYIMLRIALSIWMIEQLPEERILIAAPTQYQPRRKAHLIADPIFSLLLDHYRKPPHQDVLFALNCAIANRCWKGKNPYEDRRLESVSYDWGHGFSLPDISDWVRAAFTGVVTEQELFHHIFQDDILGDALAELTEIQSAVADDGKQRSRRGYHSPWRTIAAQRDLVQCGRDENPMEVNRPLLEYAAGIAQKLLDVVLPVELHRGDTETKYSHVIRRIQRIHGMDHLLAILTALGKDTLERSTYTIDHSKKSCLSHLLSVCVPNPDDNADALREALQSRDLTEQRMIEAALYAPEWLEIIGEMLGWKGFTATCYYFMAHMNETFDDRRRAMIAKFTPLSEQDLHLGAFDIDWFRSAYETLGAKRFAQIYDAAKYISDGTKHARARKYADAVLGKLDAEKTAAAIQDKRNKDLIMAYALIPLANDDDLSRRYLRIVQYQKEAKQFGAQRSASERKAAEIALQNLAMNAGYADVTRLTLRMESKLMADSQIYFDGIQIEDCFMQLQVDENGKVTLAVIKAGKARKAIPAKLKKHADVLTMQEKKKALTEQFRRTRQMLEEAMEQQSTWRCDELTIMLQNPVTAPILSRLVLQWGETFGFLHADTTLVSADGTSHTLAPEAELKVAHPFALYRAKVWAAYQTYLMQEKIVQPFRQVFRELYVKTDEERPMHHSLRYAGHQIQPAKTVACLKTRRWIADVDCGLQKVCYAENIIATIYAMADWFSPADIEAPTLEWVAFHNRKTGELLRIEDVPDVLFSEIMRDVDLAVSVAHAGNVDPETSHSTIELRRALLELSLPMLGLQNVTVEGSHAQIHGSRADYTVHLGSGVVHQQGGTMLAILPVHSQHRGRIFLPFADDDPKTAEILTKVLLLAEDKKIKDPSILAQISL